MMAIYNLKGETVVFLLLLLGAGISLLLTELSRGINSKNGPLIALAMFSGYCIALLVGSQSSVHRFIFYWPHPQALALIVYWLIVAIGSVLGHSSVD